MAAAEVSYRRNIREEIRAVRSARASLVNITL
jgi:hypothetical protein